MTLYIILYIGYTLYERFYLSKTIHFVPLTEVDLNTDAVWKPGEGARIREAEKAEKQKRKEMEGEQYGFKMWLRRLARHVY